MSSPSATTTPSPAPATTAVPACSSEERSASGASAATGSGPFAAATGSPVSRDSSVGQAVGLHDAGVGGDEAAGLDEQHVADHERRRPGRRHGARPPDERVGGAEVAQRPQRALGPDLGDRLDGADDHDDDEDRDRVAQLAEDRREHGDRDQQQHERLGERLDELLQDRHGLAALGPHGRRAAPLVDLLGRQAARATAGALPQDRERLRVGRDGRRPIGGTRRRRCARHETDDTSSAQRESALLVWNHGLRGP